MNINQDIESYYKSEQEAELSYRLSGDIAPLINVDKIGHELSRRDDVESLRSQSKYVDNLCLKYQGDLKLKQRITEEERDFRKVRKKTEKKDYENRLKNLIKMRNEYAQSVGFTNYLDYQFRLYEIDINLLDKKIEKELPLLYEDDTSNEEFYKTLYINSIFDYDNQLVLAKDTLKELGFFLNSDRVTVCDNLKVGVGTLVPMSIPNDLRLLVNLQSGLGGFSVFMHEIGHAIYYSNIDDTLPFDLRQGYNSMVDEGIALFFQNVIFTKEWLNKYVQYNKSLLYTYYKKYLRSQIFDVMFEREIYRDGIQSYDNVLAAYTDKYPDLKTYNWTNPHFFITAPGYSFAYLLGEFFAKSLYEYLTGINDTLFDNYTGEFLTNNIFLPGKKLNINDLLDIINF